MMVAANRSPSWSVSIMDSPSTRIIVNRNVRTIATMTSATRIDLTHSIISFLASFFGLLPVSTTGV